MWCAMDKWSSVSKTKPKTKTKDAMSFSIFQWMKWATKEGKRNKKVSRPFSLFNFFIFFQKSKWRKRKKDKTLLVERIKPKSWTRGRIIFFQNRVFAWHAVTRICGNFNNSAENFSLKFVRVYMWVEIPWKTDISKSRLATSSHKGKRSGKATKDIATASYLL